MRLRPLVFLAILCFGIALAKAKPEEPAPQNAYQAAKAAAKEAEEGDAATKPVKTKEEKAEAESDEVKPNPKLKGYDAAGGAGKKLYIVPITGTIDLGLAPFVERVVEHATADDVIILTINTPGGRIDAAVRIKDALLESTAPTIAHVGGEAISAGAFIALSCDTIFMEPGSTIGDVMPVQLGGEMTAASEKVVTYMRAQMRAVAEAKGRRKDLVEAMVDPDIEIKNVIEKGKLLTLTAEEALKLEIAEAASDNLDDTIAILNLGKAERVSTETHWAEKIARLLTDPTISSLLMTFGFLGLLMELYSPGFGVGGTIGVVCLALFFLGQYAAHLAGWEEAILFVLGFGLLALEIFVIPGFGAAGIAGFLCVAIALGMAMVELQLPWDVSFELGYFQEALSSAVIRLAVTMAVLLIVLVLMLRYGPKATAGSWLVFSVARLKEGSTEGLGAEVHGGSLRKSFDHLLAKRGIAKTVLRPAGVVEIEGARFDVVTDGRFVDPGTQVEVVEVDGHRVVVAQVAEEQDDDAAEQEI